MNAFRELDTVVLTHDVPDAGLCTGDLGGVVHLHSDDVVEVEFVTAAGRTQALLTLRTPRSTSPARRGSRCLDLLHIRSS